MTNILKSIRQKFPPNFHYLVRQEKNRIDASLASYFQKSQKKPDDIYFTDAEKIGWVPEELPGIFLNETVEAEVADALAAKNGKAIATDFHFENSREQLLRFELEHLALKNPFYLSKGESRMLWLLTQWIKQPEYFIMGSLNTYLSSKRTGQLISFFEQLNNKSIKNPTVILGIGKGESDHRYAPLLKCQNWKVFQEWIE
ncbi:hypothetical protein B6I21_06215 [candidate division KSB1 bacterium 4572_119]|nr:MAG: hypothetical protein B6I21_06215 [candidate division KSB1 bacterium 4572_119]